jgi:hypothetical protein
LQYILIPGSLSVTDGGICGPAIGGLNPFHNWDAYTFVACGPGELTVTLNSVSLVPFTGQSCFGGQGQLQALLYKAGVNEIDTNDACQDLLQDVMVQNAGATGALDAGQSFTFTIPGPGTYTFASMNWCDVAGISANTGDANYTLDFDLSSPGVAPLLSRWGMVSLLLVLFALGWRTSARRSRTSV